MAESGCKVPPFPHFATKVIHDGQEPEQWSSGAVVPPISMSSTFKQDGPGQHKGYDYSRGGNPTRDCFEKCVASMEGAKYALTFASGLGATSCLMMMMKSGNHIITSDDVYGGSNRLFSKVLCNHDLEYSFIDCTNLDLIEKTIIPGKTKMIWIETPTNPTMKVIDIEGVCKIAHKHEDIIVVTDNTFMSPYFQRPLMWGSDISFSSVTKYINGHSDTVMGCIATNNDEIYKKMKFLQNATGIIPSPFDCFLANRGAKTLQLRMQKHQKNALAVATFLESHDMVEKVYYPGLPSHPQHELVKKQCSGYSGMVSCALKGDLETATTFMKNVKLFYLAESLGGYESLLELPALMTHLTVDPAHRAMLGITDSFIRLSIGLEDAEDLIADLDQALKSAGKSN